MILWDIKHGGTTPISTLSDVLINGSLLGSPSTTGFTIEHNGDTVVFEGSFTLDELLGIAIAGGTITGFHVYSDSLAANVLDASGYAINVGGFLIGAKASDTALPSLIENPMTVNGSAGDDIFYGGPAGDSLFGKDGGDTIYGGTGDDFISGGDGSDALFGGDGYVGVDVGTDTVDYSEKTGALTIALSDDPAVNSVVTVDGVAEDTIASFENANGGQGNDQITGNGLANRLLGASGDDVLSGLGGDDMLDGGLGADSLIGGLGDDTYFVDNPGDVIAEAIGEGTDTVLSAISYALADNVENLVLLGTGALDGTGNALANVITGGAGNNALSGLVGGDTLKAGLGDDVLAGGFGLDLLTGGEGSDTFVFDAKLAEANVDHVVDFTIGADHIGLDAGIFKKVNDSGALKKKFFADGKADDGNDFVIYKEKNGKLFYDKDGDGDAKAKLVAILDGSPDGLSASDFLILA